MKVVDLLSLTFPAAASSGIVARRGVVADATNRGNVKLPAATPELTFVGATKENVDGANNVAVQVAGVAVLESDGSAVVNPGDKVILVGTTGRVKTKALADGANVNQILGTCVNDGQVPATAGAWVYVLLGPYTESLA